MHRNDKETAENQFGRQIAMRLTESQENVSHEILERLKVARVAAVAKMVKSPVASGQIIFIPGAVTASASGSLGSRESSQFDRWKSAFVIAMLVFLLGGIFGISWIQDERRAQEVADVDAEILTDELPPTAFTDAGFAEFLKHNKNASN